MTTECVAARAPQARRKTKQGCSAEALARERREQGRAGEHPLAPGLLALLRHAWLHRFAGATLREPPGEALQRRKGRFCAQPEG
jgi:hypothetical protein